MQEHIWEISCFEKEERKKKAFQSIHLWELNRNDLLLIRKQTEKTHWTRPRWFNHFLEYCASNFDHIDSQWD